MSLAGFRRMGRREAARRVEGGADRSRGMVFGGGKVAV